MGITVPNVRSPKKGDTVVTWPKYNLAIGAQIQCPKCNNVVPTGVVYGEINNEDPPRVEKYGASALEQKGLRCGNCGTDIVVKNDRSVGQYLKGEDPFPYTARKIKIGRVTLPFFTRGKQKILLTPEQVKSFQSQIQESQGTEEKPE